MRLSKKDLKALAREARKLALECTVNGPEMVNSWCGCAIGLVMRRAGVWNGRKRDESTMIAVSLDALLGGMPEEEWMALPLGGIVSEATRLREVGNEPTAVVFPLLALADACDEAAVTSGASAPQGPSKSSKSVLEEP